MSGKPDTTIALNFFPLENEDFQFDIYRRRYTEGEARDAYPGARRQRLPEMSGSGSYADYWVVFEQRDGFEAVQVRAKENFRLSVDVLFYALCAACRTKLNPEEFIVEEGFRRRVAFVLRNHVGLGREIVWLEPYNLKSARKLGFLSDFSFYAEDRANRDRRIAQLSLSLDKDGQRNRNFYVDRYARLQTFSTMFARRIFPLSFCGTTLNADTTLHPLRAEFLEPKQYVFANGRISASPFLGVRENGPLKPVTDAAKVFFVYRPEDKPLSYDLFRALRGDTFNTFLGMKKMFEFAMNKEHVGGAPLNGFDETSLEQTCRAIRDATGDSPAVAVVITPFHYDGTDEASHAYYQTKKAFLDNGIPSQFVSTELLESKSTLKWSASNIGLGVFAKMGGLPWRMVPRTESCLIVGLGQAHRVIPEGGIDRYLAYSVLTDSTGLYHDLKILGRASNPDEYLREFKSNLSHVLEQYSDRFKTFVIHTTFKIRRDELAAVKQVLEGFASEGYNFVVMKFNDDNKFFGYAPANNSMIPFEGSYLRLSRTEFVLWFEGLQRRNPTVPRKIERPVHIEFMFPDDRLTDARIRDCLQDAFNLSGANWRGFNAKSLPISVYYAQLIARFVKGSEAVGVPEADFSTLSPWFL